jgi:hypothetical protein
MRTNKRTVLGIGMACGALVAAFATGAWALDVPGLDNLLDGKKSSGPSISELAKGCESGSTSQRAACYRDASSKARKAADLCGKQASDAKGDAKKNFEKCRDEGKRTADVLACIGDGASSGGKIDDLKKTCPAKVAIKAL